MTPKAMQLDPEVLVLFALMPSCQADRFEAMALRPSPAPSAKAGGRPAGRRPPSILLQGLQGTTASSDGFSQEALGCPDQGAPLAVKPSVPEPNTEW